MWAAAHPSTGHEGRVEAGREPVEDAEPSHDRAGAGADAASVAVAGVASVTGRGLGGVRVPAGDGRAPAPGHRGRPRNRGRGLQLRGPWRSPPPCPPPRSPLHGVVTAAPHRSRGGGRQPHGVFPPVAVVASVPARRASAGRSARPGRPSMRTAWPSARRYRTVNGPRLTRTTSTGAAATVSGRRSGFDRRERAADGGRIGGGVKK